ncbi:hypothetical protein ADUPG1_008233 [Aduncisulcus paluster]|uniref:Uncharacterized protein n=1 Tax=Aduncisulcus paluster TaxID=2918883 RepID=A0ABQ5KR79_9EUKA|nr:hypothetical protein ADUPG1_008233 [Aduncisulcus paluster]
MLDRDIHIEGFLTAFEIDTPDSKDKKEHLTMSFTSIKQSTSQSLSISILEEESHLAPSEILPMERSSHTFADSDHQCPEHHKEDAQKGPGALMATLDFLPGLPFDFPSEKHLTPSLPSALLFFSLFQSQINIVSYVIPLIPSFLHFMYLICDHPGCVAMCELAESILQMLCNVPVSDALLFCRYFFLGEIDHACECISFRDGDNLESVGLGILGLPKIDTVSSLCSLPFIANNLDVCHFVLNSLTVSDHVKHHPSIEMIKTMINAWEENEYLLGFKDLVQIEQLMHVVRGWIQK